MDKRARWILFGVGLLAVAGVGWVKMRRANEPVARWLLLDGTELRLERVTYGTHHVLPGAGKLIAWLAEKAADLDSARIAPFSAEYVLNNTQPCPVVWFTCYDSRTRKFVNPPVNSPSSANVSGFQRSYDWQYRFEKPRPNVAVLVPRYDRRLPMIHMSLLVFEKPLEIDVPNPLAAASFPQWQPEPLPQTRKFGQHEIILNSLAVERESDDSIRVVPKLSSNLLTGRRMPIDFNVSGGTLQATFLPLGRCRIRPRSCMSHCHLENQRGSFVCYFSA